MARFKGSDITVYDCADLSVTQTGRETIKIKDKDVTVIVRDFRTSSIVNIIMFLLGLLCGAGAVLLGSLH